MLTNLPYKFSPPLGHGDAKKGSAPLKVLIVNRAMGTLFGGGESFDWQLAKHLKEQGIDVAILTAITFRPVTFQPLAGVDIFSLLLPNLRQLAYALEGLSSKASAFFYHIDNLIFEFAAFSWILWQSRKTKFNVIQFCALFRLPSWCLHAFPIACVSWLPGPPSRWTRRKLRPLLSNPHFALFTHGTTEQVLIKEMGLTRDSDFQVIEPGVSIAAADRPFSPFLRSETLHNPDAFFGVTVARLLPVKGHAFLLEGLAKAMREHEIEWVFLGDGPLRLDLENQASRLGVSNRVHFLGSQPMEKIHNYLAIADAFAITSRYESFSIATIEAMAHHIPVIGTRVGYLQYLIQNADAGMLVDFGDIDGLYRSFKELIGNPDRRKHFGKNGRRFAESLDWPLMATKVQNLYQRISFSTEIPARKSD